ncbi:aminotransferase class IV [Staphylococcus succinus]|uniref:aminotransferase class IV n=1 Tax=Staphylococcus succinus TaxID=61015 RepID=UPI002DB71787|nr:aminotransferase class IV [Staphylococcus succinus]MEB8125181.1 aminotransferase class IV [Staphylococcus succinus]
MQLFETMRLEAGVFPRLSYHKNRMKTSCQQLGFDFNEISWDALVYKLVETYSVGAFRVKILVDANGTFDYVVAELTTKVNFTAKLIQTSNNTSESVIVNKTTDRAHLDHNHETDIILLYDLEGKILEFDIGNIMIKEENQYYTPKYNHDFLRGCMRQSLIEKGVLQQKDYDVEEFKQKLQLEKIQVFLINSLREVADVEIYL